MIRLPTLPLDIDLDIDVDIHFDHEHHEPKLVGPLGHFTEQEIEMPTITGVSITDSQQFTWGPFNAVDKRGRVVGPATGITAVSSDPTIVTTEVGTDGVVLIKANPDDATAQLGTATVTLDDDNDQTTASTLDVTVAVGPARGLAGAVSDPVEQP